MDGNSYRGEIGGSDNPHYILIKKIPVTDLRMVGRGIPGQSTKVTISLNQKTREGTEAKLDRRIKKDNKLWGSSRVPVLTLS